MCMGINFEDLHDVTLKINKKPKSVMKCMHEHNSGIRNNARKLLFMELIYAK